GKNTLLLDIEARRKRNEFQTVFNWHSDMLLNIYYCEDCELIRPAGARPADITTKEIDGIKIFPNPVANLLQLQIPKEGFIEIWDLTGRRWFSAKSDEDQNFEIDSSNWPPGTYTLRWNDIDNNPPEIRLFLKL
ncbi:MAG: T9SS type A sorting domain-containing protein, partial [Bacteroidota bacterium]